jgi:hypothetical protein
VVIRRTLVSAVLALSFVSCGNDAQCEELQAKRKALDEQMADTPPDDIDPYNALVERNNALYEQMQELDCDLSAYF